MLCAEEVHVWLVSVSGLVWCHAIDALVARHVVAGAGIEEPRVVAMVVLAFEVDLSSFLVQHDMLSDGARMRHQQCRLVVIDLYQIGAFLAHTARCIAISREMIHLVTIVTFYLGHVAFSKIASALGFRGLGCRFGCRQMSPGPARAVVRVQPTPPP